MIKREELSNPASCMSRAKDDEMTFVLLGRDPAAAAAIRTWISERIRLGKNELGDAQIREARACLAAGWASHDVEPEPAGMIVALLDSLRDDEGNSIEIACPNREGSPNQVIEVTADWTNWAPRRFEGDSLLDCLLEAHYAAVAVRPQGGD